MTRQGSTRKSAPSDDLEPKPPELLQKLRWLVLNRSKHRCLLAFAALLCAVPVILVNRVALLSLTGIGEKKSVERVTITAGILRGRDGGGPTRTANDRELRYVYHREGDRVEIRPSLPYLHKLKVGERISGVPAGERPIETTPPQLSLRVHNKGSESILLSEIVFSVRRSERLIEAIPFVHDAAINSLIFRNEGWNDLREPHLYVELFPSKATVGGSKLFKPFSIETNLADFDQETLVDLSSTLAAFPNTSLVFAMGYLEYGPAAQRTRLLFQTTVAMKPTTGTATLPSMVYDVDLPAGRSDHKVRVSTPHELQPGASDHIVLTIWSDASAKFDIELEIYDNDLAVLATLPVGLELLVPRSSRAIQAEHRGAFETKSKNDAP